MSDHEEQEKIEQGEGQAEPQAQTLSETQQQPQQPQQKPKPVVQRRDPPPQGSIVIDFEVCMDCASHAWCTHHDESKYTQLYLDCSAEIEAQIPNTYCTYNSKKKPSTGAFEISHKGHIIFSKKTSQLFPQPKLLPERIKLFLDDLENNRDLKKWETKKEVKLEQPRVVKEKPTFQTYMKQREEQEKAAKEKKMREEEEARLKQEQEEKEKLEREQLEEQQRLLLEEQKRQEEEKLAQEKAEQERLEKEKQQQLLEQQQQQNEQNNQESNQEDHQEHEQAHEGEKPAE